MSFGVIYLKLRLQKVISVSKLTSDSPNLARLNSKKDTNSTKFGVLQSNMVKSSH